MKYKIDTVFKDIEGQAYQEPATFKTNKLTGQPLKNNDGEPIVYKPSKDLTLGMACIKALLSDSGEDKMTGEQKYEKYKLVQKFLEAKGTVELDAKEVEKVKEETGKVYVPFVVGRIWDILEQR